MSRSAVRSLEESKTEDVQDNPLEDSEVKELLRSKLEALAMVMVLSKGQQFSRKDS